MKIEIETFHNGPATPCRASVKIEMTADPIWRSEAAAIREAVERVLKAFESTSTLV